MILNRIIYGLLQKTHELVHGIKSNGINVLMFHKFTENITKDKYSISISTLKNLLFSLKSNIIHIHEIQNSKSGIVITIDDVHLSFYEKAFPIFIEYKIPFTLFICPELIGRVNYLSKEQVLKILTLGKDLVTLGNHGYYHRVSRFSSKMFVESNYKEGQNYLTENFNIKGSFFAFPYGSYYAVSAENIKNVYKIDKIYPFLTVNCSFDNFFEKKGFVPRININDCNSTNRLLRLTQ